MSKLSRELMMLCGFSTVLKRTAVYSSTDRSRCRVCEYNGKETMSRRAKEKSCNYGFDVTEKQLMGYVDHYSF